MKKKRLKTASIKFVLIYFVFWMVPMVICFNVLLRQGTDETGTLVLEPINEYPIKKLSIEQKHEILRLNDNESISVASENELSELEALKRAKLDMDYFREHGIIPSDISLRDMNMFIHRSTQVQTEGEQIDPDLLYSWNITFISYREVIELQMNAISGEVWKIKLINFTPNQIKSFDISQSLHAMANYLNLAILEEQEDSVILKDGFLLSATKTEHDEQYAEVIISLQSMRK